MIAITAAALAAVAIVTQDQTALRAAPRDSAARQAVLAPGDALEVRGERLGYLQVYDHRRERAGYVLASQVRGTSLAPTDAAELLAVLRFVRDTPGQESLGIGYAAAYLKAAPARTIDAEPFDALGTLAERLARRSGQRQSAGRDTVAAQLEVAASYGVQFDSYEHAGAVRLCYDGDAFRRVFALPATPEQRARAALALTRPDCQDPALGPLQKAERDQWRAALLDRLDADEWRALPALWRERLHVRRAATWSEVAFAKARAGEPEASRQAAQRAIDELAAVQTQDLPEEERPSYSDAALRVGAVRWAAVPLPAQPLQGRDRLSLVTRPGAPGETCVLLVDATHDANAPLARRCTYGIVWIASASLSPTGRAAALAVQPLAGWRELWVFRRAADGWQIATLPPAADDPQLGYVEFAGWVPGGRRLLLAREARLGAGTGERFKRSFEVASLETLNVEKQAAAPQSLALFAKWQDPAWKRATVSLR